jgi:hypothetical protein
MSIPRLAIERPVTMFMLSGVIMLLGLISLTRLPVDLMPDVSFPSITVRVGYQGVGPLWSRGRSNRRSARWPASNGSNRRRPRAPAASR